MKNNTPLLTACCTLALSTGILSACSSDGSSDGPDNDALRLAATLMAPIRSDLVSAKSGSFENYLSRKSDCENVPDGYAPLESVAVLFLDDDGNTLPAPALSTDECGFFDAALPDGVSRISASSVGNKPLIASVTAINASGGIASTIPEDAEYRVGFLSAFDDTTLGFSITDTVTNKAVVGLSTDAFTVSLDSQSVLFSSVTTGLASEQASIVVVTDASGSMSNGAFSDEATGIDYSRLNLSAIASHAFLDQKAPADEIAMVIFDGQTDFIDQDAINDIFTFEDANGMAASYEFPATGFTQDSAQMRLIVDAYNEDSQLWDEDNVFARHADTPMLSATGRYEWGGSTAFYSSAILASDKLAERNSPRKFILAMTDGQNNRGERDIQVVIETANANRTPVYTIGFEFADEDDLTRIATETGATYFQADSLELTDAYNSIQTNILFQYVGTLSEVVGNAEQIVLDFDIDADGVPEASRSISTAPVVTP